MRVLLVGANPSKKNLFSHVPFVGTKSEKVLNEWIEFLDLKNYTIINASDRVLEKGEKLQVGDFNIERLVRESEKHDVVIALGADASKACSLCAIEHYKLPHPSGLNRQLNDKEYVNGRLKEVMVRLWK